MPLSDDEARKFAADMITDYLAGVEPDPISVYALLGPDDQIPLGRHLIPRLTAAAQAFNDGDRSTDTVKLVALCLQMEKHKEQAEREREQRKLDTLRDKAFAFAGNPELAAQMTQGSGVRSVPVPASATPLRAGVWAADGTSAAELVSFYLRLMAAAGWVFDLRASWPDSATNAAGRYTPLIFGLPDPVVWVSIYIWEDPQVAPCPAIQIFENADDDPPSFDWLKMAA